jgi:ABC-type nitrate/sulfonate/bicarbonate transport system permease component
VALTERNRIDMSNSAAPPDGAQSTGDSTGRKERGPLARFLRRPLVLPILSVIVFLAVWQILGAQVNPILLATPDAVATSLVQLIGSGQLVAAFLHAMAVLGVGFTIAAVVGIAVGLLMGRSPVAWRILNPYVSFFQATPLVALIPLVVIWTGIGFQAEVTITVLLAVWSVIVNTAEGTKNTPPILLDMASIYHATERSIVRNVALPNAIPYIFAGLRIALAKALIGVIIGEMDISLQGLGGLIVNFGDSFQTAPLLASIVTSSIVGVIGTVILEILRRRLAPWSVGGHHNTRV